MRITDTGIEFDNGPRAQRRAAAAAIVSLLCVLAGVVVYLTGDRSAGWHVMLAGLVATMITVPASLLLSWSAVTARR